MTTNKEPKIKKVTRTWTTRSGVRKTITYEYGSRKVYEKAPKSPYTFKSGKLKKSAFASVENIKEAFAPVGKVSTIEAFELRDVYKSAKAQGFKSLSPERIYATYAGDRLLGMLANTRFTLDDLAKKTNSSADELLNSANWSEDWDIFTNEKGEQYQFTFSYEGDTVFRLIYAPPKPEEEEEKANET